MKKYLMMLSLLLVNDIALQAVQQQRTSKKASHISGHVKPLVGQGSCALEDKNMGLWYGNECKMPDHGDACMTEEGLRGTWETFGDDKKFGQCRALQSECWSRQGQDKEKMHGLWNGTQCVAVLDGQTCYPLAGDKKGTWHSNSDQCIVDDKDICIIEKSGKHKPQVLGLWDKKSKTCKPAKAGDVCLGYELQDYELDTFKGTWNPLMGCQRTGNVCLLDERGKTSGLWDGKQCNPAEDGAHCTRRNVQGTFFKNKCQLPERACTLSENEEGIWDEKTNTCNPATVGDVCKTTSGSKGTWDPKESLGICMEPYSVCSIDVNEKTYTWGTWKDSQCAPLQQGDMCRRSSTDGKLGTYAGETVLKDGLQRQGCLLKDETCQNYPGGPKGKWDGKECVVELK